MNFLRIMTILSVGLLGVLAPQAKADEWNKKTVVTFSGPVEIPGQVLQPGTYVFKLADSMSDRNIVQVYNKDENHLYGTFLAIPDYRLQPTGKTVVTFEERAANSPEAVKAWFYPGDNYGHDFVYPKSKAMELAKANHQPVASMPNDLTANTTTSTTNTSESHVTAMKQAPLKAQQPSQEEVDVAQAFPPSKPAQSSTTTATQPSTQASNQKPTEMAANRTSNLPNRLPKTASPLPLIGLAGLLSLGVAELLRRSRARLQAHR